MRKILALILFSLMIFFVEPSTAHATINTASQIDDYTIMIYLNGSSLESGYDYSNRRFRGNATQDLEEMIAGYEENDTINIIVQTAGTKRWNNDFVNSEETQRFLLTPEGFELQYATVPQNVGYKKGLSDFIKWSYRNYPAKRYGLIMWNHGGGPVKGFGSDELFTGDTLHLEELDSALDTAKTATDIHFEFIGFDACLMASIEVANTLSPYSNYLFASEEIEPSHGWNYKTFLEELQLEPTMSGKTLGRIISDSYLEEANNKGHSYNITFSVIDLSKIDALVEALENLLYGLMPNFDDPRYFYDFAKAVGKSRSFGGNSNARGYTDLVDLKDFGQQLNNFLAVDTSQLIEKLDEAVVYKIDGSHSKNTGGLSLYFPLKDKKYYNHNMALYKKTGFSKTYLAFLTHFKSKLSALDSNDPIEYDIRPPGKKSDFYTIEFDEEDRAKIANVYMALYLLNDNDSYQNHSYQSLGYDRLIYNDDSAGYYHEIFDKQWLYLDDVLLRLAIVNDTSFETEYESLVYYNGEQMFLSFSYDKSLDTYDIHGLRRGWDPVTGKPDKAIYQLKAGDTIQAMYKMYHEKRHHFEWLKGDTHTITTESQIRKKNVPADHYVIAFRYYDFSYQHYVTEYFKFQR